jgi:uncharacterized membrane protein
MEVTVAHDASIRRDRPRQGLAGGPSMWSGALIGVGIAGFVDETVFHQLLHWHHFYDRSTPAAGLVSDGLFHAFSWFAIVGELFWFADLRRRGTWWNLRWWAGLCLGLGGFQLYDGTVQHKLLDLHQIRYQVVIWPYDLVWDLAAVIALLVGAALLARSRRAGAAPSAQPERPTR